MSASSQPESPVDTSLEVPVVDAGLTDVQGHPAASAARDSAAEASVPNDFPSAKNFTDSGPLPDINDSSMVRMPVSTTAQTWLPRLFSTVVVLSLIGLVAGFLATPQPHELPIVDPLVQSEFFADMSDLELTAKETSNGSSSDNAKTSEIGDSGLSTGEHRNLTAVDQVRGLKSPSTMAENSFTRPQTLSSMRHAPYSEHGVSGQLPLDGTTFAVATANQPRELHRSHSAPTQISAASFSEELGEADAAASDAVALPGEPDAALGEPDSSSVWLQGIESD